MSKGKESDPHRVMSEAFEFRLKSLYPDSKISFGKKIQPVGLKPDVYIEHPDGRKCVYEMVHGNKNPKHLLENHSKYQSDGIKDYWILWDDPLASKTEFPIEQGFMAEFLQTPRGAIQPNRLVQAILDIHAEHFSDQKSVIYCFDMDDKVQESELAPEFIKSFVIGIVVYKFDSYAVYKDSIVPIKDFISLAELGFDTNGSLLSEEIAGINETLLEAIAQGQGLDVSTGYSESELLSKIKDLTTDKEKRLDVLNTMLLQAIQQLTKDEIEELQMFSVNGKLSKLQPIQLVVDKPAESIDINSTQGLLGLSQAISAIPDALESRNDLPDSLKKLIGLLLGNSEQIKAVGSIMEWQEKSEAMQRLTKKEDD